MAPLVCHPGGRWHVTAHGPTGDRLTGAGDDALAALGDLVLLLREYAAAVQRRPVPRRGGDAPWRASVRTPS